MSAATPIFVVTRPVPDQEALCEALRGRGLACLHSPAVERSPETLELRRRRAGRLVDCDRVVVTSPYAAALLVESMPAATLRAMRCVAPGEATARLLRAAGASVAWPESGGTSEDLLELEALRLMNDGVVGIVGAPGGRRLLDRELGARGIRIERVDLYRRNSCGPCRELREAIRSGQPLIVLISSVGGFDRLDEALRVEHENPWRASTLVVSSDRVADRCFEAGARNVVRAAGASDSAMLAAVDRLISARRSGAG